MVNILIENFLKNNFKRFYFVAGISLICFLGFAPNPAFAGSADSIVFDRSDMYFINHGAVVTLTNPYFVTNDPNVIDTTTITVQILNAAKTPIGSPCTVTVTETNVNTDIFVSPAMKILSTGATCPNFNAVDGYWIYAKYNNDPTTFAETVIRNSYYSPNCPNPGPCQALQSYATNYFIKPAVSRGFSQNFNTDTCAERVPALADTDSDGICDIWEDQEGSLDIAFTEGGTNYSYSLTCGSTESQLPECPSVGTKDVLVEIDSIKHHRPTAAMIDAVKTAFANSGQTMPIRLHYQLDEEINFHRNTLSKFSSGSQGSVLSTATDVDRIKAFYFGLPSERNNANDIALHAKRQAFHYVLFTHLRSDSTTSSGWAELTGNDAMISLGAFTQGTGSPADQSAAFMHELGHNLGLDHGGAGDAVNCKPNYPSVMNYIFEFTNYIPERPLDYSREALPVSPWSGASMTETTLNENWSISSGGTYRNARTVYGTPTLTPNYQIATISADGSPGTNWDGSSPNNEDPSTSPNPDINDFNISPDCNDSWWQTLSGKRDWDSLTYIFQNWSAGQDGAGFPGDLTIETPEEETPDEIDYDVQQDNTIRFIALEEESQTAEPALDPTANIAPDEPMEEAEIGSSVEQSSDDLNVEISGGFDEDGNLKIYEDFYFKKKPLKNINYHIVVTQDDDTILDETHYEEDASGHQIVVGLESRSPAMVEVTVLGIGQPDNKTSWIVPMKNVVSFGISSWTPEISYHDVMEMRKQTVLYLKSVIEENPIKPESTKNKIIEKLDEVAKLVKPDKILIDETDGSHIINDHLGTALQELVKIKQTIIESETDPTVIDNVLKDVDDRILAFGQAAEPASVSPGGEKVEHINLIQIILIGVFIAFGVLLFALRAARKAEPAVLTE